MKKLIILGVFLVLLSGVVVGFQYGPSDIETYLSFDNNVTDRTGNLTYSATNEQYSTTRVGGSHSWSGTHENPRYVTTAGNINCSTESYTVAGWFKVGTEQEQTLFSWDSSAQTLGDFDDGGDILTFRPWVGSCGSTTYNVVYSDDNWHFIAGIVNQSGDSQYIYYDGDIVASESSCGFSGGFSKSPVWGTKNTVPSVYRDWGGLMDDWFIICDAMDESDLDEIYENNLTYPFASTSPSITQINFTSEGGQICGNGTTCGPTDDTTPTFKITTDLDTSCRISDVYQTYDDMGASRDCSPGVGTSFTCTLITDDALILGGTDQVYVACYDTIEEINISLEQGGGSTFSDNSTQAILDGIEASSAVSPTTYTNQQVYIRYSDSTQKLTTAEVVTVQGNQRWIFNYLINESATGMTSIGTVINVWENISLTYTQIVNQVRDFIDATIN